MEIARNGKNSHSHTVLNVTLMVAARVNVIRAEKVNSGANRNSNDNNN